MKIVFRANNILEMHIVAGMLKANGVEPITNGLYLQGAIGDLPATDFAIIQVKDEDFDQATQLIKEYENIIEA